MDTSSTLSVANRNHNGQPLPLHEHTPLLVDTASSHEDDYWDVQYHHSTSSDIQSMASQKGTSSAKNVGINLAKTAAGTGILALPYACKEGGLLLFIFGTVLISVWNVYGVKRLCDCLELMVRAKGHYSRRSPPPGGTATLGKVAYYALGDIGLIVLDLMLLFLLMGIVIAYEVAILSFTKGTSFTTGNILVDGFFLAFLLVPLCIVDDMSNLSRLSRLGLIILGLTMLVIAGYGINGHEDGSSGGRAVVSNPFNLFPTNGLTGVSHWFGCVVFGFGIVPLTFNFRESMAQPEELPVTALVSMLLVAAAYIVIGIGLLYLYPDIDNDVLSQIPDGGLATVTRLAMIVVIMATAPLLIVPCAEIIEGKIHHDGQVHNRTRILARTSLCLFTVGISVVVPGFVAVLSFVGCFSVALVSFGVPPFLHWVLLHHQNEGTGSGTYPLCASVSDLILCLCGIGATGVTTLFSFLLLIESETKSE